LHYCLNYILFSAVYRYQEILSRILNLERRLRLSKKSVYLFFHRFNPNFLNGFTAALLSELFYDFQLKSNPRRFNFSSISCS
jgi:hypothetical protein